jgi:protein-S-isoprenylcysteine O-methyltransferase Ste14
MLLRHLLSILILPFTVVVAVPTLLLAGRSLETGSPVALVAGGLVFGMGLSLVIVTIWHFATRGRGTLAPWDPPVSLVVAGVYRHVRNPMITGVLLILIGETVLFRSPRIAIWVAIVFLVNAIYIPMVEEQSLLDRFGSDYDAYRRHVPRWIPRLRAWRGPT